MKLNELFNGLLRQQSRPPSHFTLDDSHLLDTRDAAEQRFLQPQASYFEIRLKQMYLQNQREFWRSFRPFSTFVTSFVSSGSQRELPFVIGPERLGRLAESAGGDAVEYRNLRVAGPFPYEGDDLTLTVSLSRLVEQNWAVQTLSLLETFATAFDASKLSSYLNIAAPLVNGLEGLLGMQDVELRLGMQRAYEQPVGRGGTGPDTLRARHELLLNLPESSVSGSEQQRFWVKDGRLFYGDSTATARPYRAADFLLFEIRPLSMRGDYMTFDFHRVQWEGVKAAIWENGAEAAQQKLKLMMAALVQCQDIIRPQRNALMQMYKQQFDEDIAQYQEMVGDMPLRGAGDPREELASQQPPLTEEDMTRLMTRSQNDPLLQAKSPEMMLADLGL